MDKEFRTQRYVTLDMGHDPIHVRGNSRVDGRSSSIPTASSHEVFHSLQHERAISHANQRTTKISLNCEKKDIIDSFTDLRPPLLLFHYLHYVTRTQYKLILICTPNYMCPLLSDAGFILLSLVKS